MQHCVLGYGKEDEQFIQAGNSDNIVTDRTKDEISFVVNEMNLGVAYEGIPLDKPLVPCVILGYEGDSVELVI